MRKPVRNICIILTILFCFFIFIGHIAWFDQNIYEALISLKTDSVTDMFIIISDIIYLVVLISILFLLLYRDKKVSFLVLINLVLSFLLSSGLKFMFRRSRPIDIALVTEHGYSMPSSHAMVSVSFFGLIFYIIYKNYPKGKFKTFMLLFLLFYILMIGLSRIYLGVHYASDVLLGFTIGIIYLIIFVTHFDSLLIFEKKDKK